MSASEGRGFRSSRANSRSPRARVAVSASGGQRHRGVRHEGLLAYGRRVAVSTSEGLFSASEGRGVCESRCPQRSRTSRAKGRGLHELGVARGSTLVERGSFDGLVRLVHVPKVEETRTILDFLWYGRVTDQRRVESTFDVRRSTFDRSKASIRIACSMCLVPVCHHQAQARCIPQQPSSIVDGRVTRPTSSRVR